MRGVPAPRALCGYAAYAACAAALLAVSGGGHARAGNGRAGVLIPSSPRGVLPLEGHTIHSTNWSGYAVTSKRRRITAVTGSFVVPKVTGTAPFGFAATWMGIGGYNTHDLIQAGTAEDSKSGGLYGKQYFAWYELLPAGERQLHKCIGDRKCRVSRESDLGRGSQSRRQQLDDLHDELRPLALEQAGQLQLLPLLCGVDSRGAEHRQRADQSGARRHGPLWPHLEVHRRGKWTCDCGWPPGQDHPHGRSEPLGPGARWPVLQRLRLPRVVLPTPLARGAPGHS